ncbi:MAG: NADH-quinone oxidoreductase subunit N [Verrucomicrobiia bacterium]
MNAGALIVEISAAILGLAVLIIGVAAPEYLKRAAGLLTLFGLCLILLFCFTLQPYFIEYAFGGAYVMDGLAVFAKKFFVIAAILIVLLLLAEESKSKPVPCEYYALIIFALIGMMLAASASNLILLFVSIELVTVSFYVLTGFNKNSRLSLEAGIKYLVYSGVASAFLVFGIALVYGMSGVTGFKEISETLKGKTELVHSPLLQIGFGMILVGLGFKIAMAPFQLWVPDVYQGAPSPTTAFLATGSKAAGFVLLIRFFLNAGVEVTTQWREQLIALSILTILYGNLCAIPQRNVKRLIGYSSIAHAGYLLMGIATLGIDGVGALLYYLFVYMLAVLAIFGVLGAVYSDNGKGVYDCDIGIFSGFHKRSQFLAVVMTIALASLAGIPPLAGFFGKFLLVKSALAASSISSSYYYLIAAAIGGVAVSIYYYFGIIKLIYWDEPRQDADKLEIGIPVVVLLVFAIVGMLYWGIMPSGLFESAKSAANAIGL